MSSSEPVTTESEAGEVPTFELACIYDEVDDPSAVTIFDPDVGDLTTRWITADLEASVALDEVA